ERPGLAARLTLSPPLPRRRGRGQNRSAAPIRQAQGRRGAPGREAPAGPEDETISLTVPDIRIPVPAGRAEPDPLVTSLARELRLSRILAPLNGTPAAEHALPYAGLI